MTKRTSSLERRLQNKEVFQAKRLIGIHPSLNLVKAKWADSWEHLKSFRDAPELRKLISKGVYFDESGRHLLKTKEVKEYKANHPDWPDGLLQALGVSTKKTQTSAA